MAGIGRLCCSLKVFACEQAKAQDVLRRQMRHVLYTEPSAPQAGQDMTVYYNPSDTCLNGSSDVYITVGALACPLGIRSASASYAPAMACLA